MPVVPFIVTVYILTVCAVFFTFFTARIAQMKLRSGAWGALGLLLGPVGMLLVCYLPSKRKDGKETNPIRSGVRALPKFSRKLFWILTVLLAVVLLVIYFVNGVPKWQEDRNYRNSIGAGVKSRLYYPTTVEGEIAQVFSGRDSTYAVTGSGDVYTWGYNELALAQQDKGAALSNTKQVAQLDRKVYVLKQDNKLYELNENGDQKEMATNVAFVAASDTYGVFIKTTGDLYVWGSNANGQLGSAGSNDADKPLWLCGGAKSAALGARHLLILKTDGAVVGVGSNQTGALAKPSLTVLDTPTVIAKGVKAVAAGNEFSLILKEDGTLESCGINNCGQLGRTVTGKQKGSSLYEVAKGVKEIGAGAAFGWYIDKDDTLYTWGQNHCGQLGIGNTKNQSEPQKVMGGVTAAAATHDHLVLLAKGTMYTCGNNTYGQLGRPDKVELSPTADVSVKK